MKKHPPDIIKLVFFLILTVLLWAGCAGVVKRLDPPRVSLVDMGVEKISLMETSYRIVLRVMNPNDGALHVKGVSCELELNGEPFASGVAALDVKIPPFGTETLQVPLYSSHVSLFREVLGMHEKEEFEYRLRGKLVLEGGKMLTPSVSFSSEGKWALKTPVEPNK